MQTFEYQARGAVGIGNVLNTILENRGIENVVQFLKPTDACLEDAHLLDNIDTAADMLISHLHNKSRITVVQDCDCDGITSAALIISYIHRVFRYDNVQYIIHDNKEHGLDKQTMLEIEKQKPDLVIIPDAGSNDLRQLKALKRAGIDVIVLDHHDESEKVTRFKSLYKLDNLNDFAIIVNNQMSHKIKDKAMTGVGITYKFCKILDEKTGVQAADDYLDLVALGMIGDSCDLTNLQSRYLVLKGIEQISNGTNRNTFITELVKSQAFSLHNKVTILGISFYIAPLVNSLIRLGTHDDKEIMLKAFLGATETVKIKIRGQGEIEVLIQEQARRLCESYKRKQQKLTSDYADILKKQIDDFNLNSLPVICCKTDRDIETTFTGLIANKLTSVYCKPCVLLRDVGDCLSGSARGYDKSAIKDIKEFCLSTKLFDLAEGHSNACGVKIKKDNIAKFYDYLSGIKSDDQLHYTVDAVFSDKTLKKEVVELVSKYSDVWGTSVEEPLFAITDIVVNSKDVMLMGKNKNTIKFTHHNIDFIKFNASEKEHSDIISLGEAVKFTVIGRFDMNEYNGQKTPQVRIENYMCEKSSPTKIFRF